MPTHPFDPRKVNLPISAPLIYSAPPAPVALFAYNRPDHFRETTDALGRNTLADKTEVTIFIDGPKTPADKQAGADICHHVSELKGFKKISLVRRATNLGLAQSIIGGVSEMLQRYDRIIVLEDDMVTAPQFLTYMNGALALYAEDTTVASIHGWMYPIEKELPGTFFLKGTDCWGWGTWRRAWETFNPDGSILLKHLEGRGLTQEFDLDGAAQNCEMLRAQVGGANDSWAIRWHASAYLNGMLTLFPGRTLVRNIGNDGSGTHCQPTTHWDGPMANRSIVVERQPVAENHAVREEIKKFLWAAAQKRSASRRPSLLSRLKQSLPFFKLA